MAPGQFTTNSVDNLDSMSPDQVLKASPTVELGPSEMYPSAPSKSNHDDVVKGENKTKINCLEIICLNLNNSFIAILK